MTYLSFLLHYLEVDCILDYPDALIIDIPHLTIAYLLSGYPFLSSLWEQFRGGERIDSADKHKQKKQENEDVNIINSLAGTGGRHGGGPGTPYAHTVQLCPMVLDPEISDTPEKNEPANT